MRHDSNELLSTRTSLLKRLRNWDDQEGWRDFFNTYWELIYRVGIKCGLNDAEAQDVVQETVIAVAKKMEDFKYDPAVDSFKGWLFYLTRKRIAMHYRRRKREHDGLGCRADAAAFSVEELPDPAGVNLEAVWDDEWEQNLLDSALARVKHRVNSKKFQIFNLCVVKQRPV